MIPLLLASTLLFACSTSLEDYEQSTPEFNLQQYFDGKVTAWGVVQDYSTQVTRRFCVDIVGSWHGSSGQLHETFYYHDGEEQVRIWSLNIANNGEVTGTAGDVVGAARGRASGSAFNWQYVLQVNINQSQYEFAIDDWMYQLDEQRVMNRSYMKKFGLTVAEISIFFDKSQPLRECH